MNTESLDYPKIERCKKALIDAYRSSSIVANVLTVRDYDENRDSGSSFYRLGHWTLIPREWFIDPSILPDEVFLEIGHGIAIGEEKTIVQQLLKNDNIEHKKCDRIDYESIQTIISDLVSKSFHPTSLFIPIELYSEAHLKWAQGNAFSFNSGESLKALGLDIKVFWSSKYNPFQSLIVLDVRIGEWIAKPNYKERLFVDLKVNNDQMLLAAYTTYHLTLLESRAAIVVEDFTLPP